MKNFEILGHSPEYWIDLQRRFEETDPSTAGRRSELVEEVADLRKKLEFCKTRIREINQILGLRSE